MVSLRIVISLVVALGCASIVQAHGAELLPTKIREAAKEEVMQMGYDVEGTYYVEMDRRNTVWNSYLGELEHGEMAEGTEEHFRAIASKLENKSFWTVYFSFPVKMLGGGEVFVFVDAHTAEVLAVWGGR